jgi:hypothetical protein
MIAVPRSRRPRSLHDCHATGAPPAATTPSDSNHNFHALLLSHLLLVPFWLARRSNVLDDWAVGDVLVAGLCGLSALGLECCGVAEGFEDGLDDSGVLVLDRLNAVAVSDRRRLCGW